MTHSTVIVIGTAPNNEPDSIRVQDPSKASVQSVGSGYSLLVERYLKGSGGDTIPIIQFYGFDFTDRGKTRQVRDKNENLLLDGGSRYLLFLKESESYPGLLERHYPSLQVPAGGWRGESGESGRNYGRQVSGPPRG